MRSGLIAFGLAASVMMSLASPSLAQNIQLGPDGVRIVPPGMQDDARDGDRRDDNRRDRRNLTERREISESEAVRIAKGEGVRNVDGVRRMRDAYRIIGVDRRGDDISVMVDRRTGDVLGVR